MSFKWVLDLMLCLACLACGANGDAYAEAYRSESDCNDYEVDNIVYAMMGRTFVRIQHSLREA